MDKIQKMLVATVAATPVFAWLGNRFGSIIDLYRDPLEGFLSAPIDMWGDIARYPLWIGTEMAAMLCTLIFACIPWIIFMGLLIMRRENQRKGEEHGSGRFAEPRELAILSDLHNPDPKFNTIPLSENVALACSREKFDKRVDRNMNVFILGGPGSGKTRGYVKPNMMQLYGDFVVTDPKGDLVMDMGPWLVEQGYNIRIFDTFVTDRSLIYNPLAYVKTDLEIVSFVNMFISMTTGTQKSGGDPFWDKAEKALFMALIAYMRDYLPPHRYHLGTLLTLMTLIDASEDDENAKSRLDYMFDEIATGIHLIEVNDDQSGDNVGGTLEQQVSNAGRKSGVKEVPTRKVRRDGKSPFYDGHAVKSDIDGKKHGFRPEEDFALENYTNFKKATGKTLKSIIVSVNVRLAPFTAHEVRRLVSGPDQMHLDQLGDTYFLDPETLRPREFPRGDGATEKRETKNAIFCIFRDTDQKTLGFLHGMLVYQTINVLCEKALRAYGGKLPRMVNLVLDEFRSLNLPADISGMISVARSRNIGMSIILQNISQFNELYDEATGKSIRSCCDTMLFLGAAPTDEETCKYISDACGQQTVYDENISSQHGGSGGWSRSGNKIARPLITPDEVSKLPGDTCIVLEKGFDPVKDAKYPLEKHPRYAECMAVKSDFNEMKARFEDRREAERAESIAEAKRIMEEKHAKAVEERDRRVAERQAELDREYELEVAAYNERMANIKSATTRAVYEGCGKTEALSGEPTAP